MGWDLPRVFEKSGLGHEIQLSGRDSPGPAPAETGVGHLRTLGEGEAETVGSESGSSKTRKGRGKDGGG